MGVLKTLKNKYIIFTISKYLIYFIKFVQGVYIAAVLGPYYFGLWGFIIMIIEYLKYTTFGLEHSVNIELSTINKNELENKRFIGGLIGNSLIITLFFSLLITILTFIIHTLDINFANKYDLNRFLLIIIMFTVFNNLSMIFTNIYRSYVNLNKIIISELVFGIIPFVTIFIFKGEQLLFVLLYAMLFARVISVSLFIFKFPFPIRLSINYKLAKQLIYVGFGLLVYNVSYSLAFMSARTVVSIFYEVKEMGYFSLAYTITSATLLGLNALVYVVYPKILYNLREELDNETTYLFLQRITTLYSKVVVTIVLFVILFIPILFIFLEEYKPIAPTLNLLLLSQAIYSFSTIQASLAFARKKQYMVAKFSLLLLSITILLYICLGYFHFHYKYIALSLMLYVSLYTIWQTRFANRLLLKKLTYVESFKQIFTLKLLIPFTIIIVLNLIGLSNWSGIGFFIFVILDLSEIRFVVREIKVMVKNNL